MKIHLLFVYFLFFNSFLIEIIENCAPARQPPGKPLEPPPPGNPWEPITTTNTKTTSEREPDGNGRR